MKKSFPLLVLVIAPVAFMGFGCKKTTPQNPPVSTTSSQSTGSDVYLPPPPPPESERIKNLRDLRTALQAFQRVNTFRAKLTVQRQDGLTTGQIDVVKPNRFHGTLKTPQDQTTNEVIGIGSSMYVRIPDTGWIEVKTTSTAKALSEAFRSTVDGDSSVIQTAIPNDAIVTKQYDETRTCDAYQTDITPKDSNTIHLMVCVQKSLPAHLEFQTDQGSMTMDYFDYNTLFTIERPTVLKIQENLFEPYISL